MTLFDDAAAHARRGDPETSHLAARSVERIRLSQHAVMRVFDQDGPMHDQRMISLYNGYVYFDALPVQSESGLRTRRKELVEMGRLKDSGLRVVLHSGRQSIVWMRA